MTLPPHIKDRVQEEAEKISTHTVSGPTQWQQKDPKKKATFIQGAEYLYSLLPSPGTDSYWKQRCEAAEAVIEVERTRASAERLGERKGIEDAYGKWRSIVAAQPTDTPSATPATVEDAVKRVFYTRADIRNISGVDLWAEGVVYEPIQVDLRTLSNWERLSIDARYMTENPAPYIKSMMNRLELGGGLQSIIIDEDNYMTDGFHRTMAYILSNKFIVNALKRVKQ